MAIVNALLTRFADLMQQQPQLYNELTKTLTPEEQQVVKYAIEQADKIAMQASASAQGGAEGLPTQTNGNP